MPHAVTHAVQYLSDRGCTFTLSYEGEIICDNETNPVTINALLHDIGDICRIIVWDGTGLRIGSLIVMPDGPNTCSPDETVIDFTTSALIDAWWITFAADCDADQAPAY
jgi:hypothetical protein